MSGNNGVVNLQSIGIEMQDDGTLSVDSTTLNDALQNNFSAVQNLFQVYFRRGPDKSKQVLPP